MSKVVLVFIELLCIVCLLSGILTGATLGGALKKPHTPKPESTKESSMPTLPAENLLRLVQLEWHVERMFALHEELDKEQDPARSADLTASLDATLADMRALIAPVAERKYPESVAEQIARARLEVLTKDIEPREVIWYPPSLYIDNPRGGQTIVETDSILKSLSFRHTEQVNRWIKEA